MERVKAVLIGGPAHGVYYNISKHLTTLQWYEPIESWQVRPWKYQEPSRETSKTVSYRRFGYVDGVALFVHQDIPLSSESLVGELVRRL